MSDELIDKRDKIHPERRKISVYIAITITISIPLSLLAFWLGRATAPQTAIIQAVPTTVITAQPTTLITPTPIPTQVTPIFNTINQKLTCQSCQEPNVTALIKSYSVDQLGYTSLTLLFTNHTNNAVNMKVDTIIMVDQSNNSIPLFSNNPYIPIGVGQTAPISVVFNFVPQQGTKYTFSISVEQANVFANFYQSNPLTLSQ